MKYLVRIWAHAGAVAGRTPEYSGVLDTLEEVQSYIDSFQDNKYLTIEEIKVFKGEEIPVIKSVATETVVVETSKRYSIK